MKQLVVTLINGRKYLLQDTKKGYMPGEYNFGGIIVKVWTEELTNPAWTYVDNFSDFETVFNFLHSMSK